jgi:hypothetical protein
MIRFMVIYSPPSPAGGMRFSSISPMTGAFNPGRRTAGLHPLAGGTHHGNRERDAACNLPSLRNEDGHALCSVLRAPLQTTPPLEKAVMNHPRDASFTYGDAGLALKQVAQIGLEFAMCRPHPGDVVVEVVGCR